MFAIQNFSTKQRRNLMFLWLKIHNFKSCKLFLLYFFFLWTAKLQATKSIFLLQPRN